MGDGDVDQRVLSVLSNLAGDVVVVSKRDGAVYEGILDPDTLRSKSFATLTLSLVCQLSPQQRVLGQQKLAVAVADILSIRCASFTSTSAHNPAGSGFQTDTCISSSLQHQTGKRRELQAWVPDSEPTCADMTMASAPGKPWDQFSANERLFGVRTDFDESAYTTNLDKKDPKYAERAAKADRLAREINSTAKATTNPHLIEERTGVLREGDDEEDLYGAVIRGASDGAPPGFSLPTAPQPQSDDVVTLPSQFEADRAKISRQFTALQEELARDTVIEVPLSIKSKLNPTAEAFVPSASSSGDALNGDHGVQYQPAYQPQAQQQPEAYYYYDEYGNCYFYDPYYPQYY